MLGLVDCSNGNLVKYIHLSHTLLGCKKLYTTCIIWSLAAITSGEGLNMFTAATFNGKKLLEVCVVRCWVQCCFQQFFNHVITVSVCNRKLSAHFYSAISLNWYAPVLSMIPNSITLHVCVYNV